MRYISSFLLLFFFTPMQAQAASLVTSLHTDSGDVQAVHVDNQNNIFFSTDTPALSQLSANQTQTAWVSPVQLTSFSQSAGITTDSLGNIYFTDATANSLYYVDTTTGNIQTITSALNQPAGIAMTLTGDVVVANMGSHQVLLVSSNGNMSIIAGTGIAGYSGDNALASNAQLSLPSGIAVEGSSIYVSEIGNHTVRRFTVGGAIETIVGTGTTGFIGDNGAASLAKLSQPADITLDSSGNLYIADSANHRIRKMNSIDHIITTIAGTGSSLSSTIAPASPALSTALPNPSAIGVDSLGNVYVNSGKQIVQISVDSNASLGTPPATCVTPTLHPFSWIGIAFLAFFLYRVKASQN